MPFFVVQRASKSFCHNRSEFSSHPSGSLTALISLFSSRVLRCLGTGSRVASMIRPPPGLKPLFSQVCLKHLKELLDNSCLAQSLSEEGDCGGIWNAVHHTKPDKFLKGASVVLLDFRFINCKQKATPMLRMRSCSRTSILIRISGSILLRPALLLRS